MAMFGKPRKVGVGKPRNEAERKKVNKRLKDKYGYTEAFKANTKGKSARTQATQTALERAGISSEDMPSDVDKRKRKGK